MKVIISGGGTGGHIFPAIAIANKIKDRKPDVDILFVGAEGRMEMERVPKAGYDIQALPIAGLQRKQFWKNISLPWKLWKSMSKALSILKSFNPDVAVGVGGYASGPMLRAAQKKNIPTVVQEQNSYAGLTNKLLAKKANAICVAYEHMDQFFPKEKITITGNPIRDVLKNISIDQQKARTHFGLDPNKSTILITGGSLGARSLNVAMENSYEYWEQNPDVQVIWQAGKVHIDYFSKTKTARLPNVTCKDFLDHMEYAYQAADLMVCRAGAITISEICLLGKAAILVPSPYVAEDHQTKNANALVENNAAKLISEQDISQQLVPTIKELLEHPESIQQMEQNAKAMGKPNALDDIVDIIFQKAKNG